MMSIKAERCKPPEWDVRACGYAEPWRGIEREMLTGVEYGAKGQG